MHPVTFHRFEDAYAAVLGHVGQEFEHINAPPGNAARECLNVSFVLSDPRDRIVYLPARRVNIVFCFAEALWYLWGRDDLEMISYYAPRLARISADAATLTGTAYGPKLFRPDPAGCSQWQRLVKLLAADPASKRAVATFFRPEELADSANPDVSCTLALQFLLRDGHLHLVIYIRGNDAVTGLLCDVFSFTLIQEFTAHQLSAKLGSYAHHVGSMHINDVDTAGAAAIASSACREYSRSRVPMAGRPPLARGSPGRVRPPSRRPAMTGPSEHAARCGAGAAEIARGGWGRWSVILLKPDCVARGLVEQVLARFRREAEIVAQQTVTVTEAQIFAHYDDLLNAPERLALVNVAADLRRCYVGRQVVVALAHGAPAVPGRMDTPARLRALLGHYDPARAVAGSIRGDLGVDSLAKARAAGRLIDNLVHTSDDAAAARRDFVIWFGVSRTDLLSAPSHTTEARP